MMEARKGLDHGVINGPRFTGIEQHSLADGLVKEAFGVSRGTLLLEDATDHGPYILGLLEVTIESSPVAVVVGNLASQV